MKTRAEGKPTVHSQDLRDYLANLQVWVLTFDRAFSLGIEAVLIAIAPLPKKTLGQFRYRGGMTSVVLLSSELVCTGPMFKVLGVLLHELLHAWQHKYGTIDPNHHNAEFRAKAYECGLIVTVEGFQTYQSRSRFFDLLKAHGVPVPEEGGNP